MKIVGFKQQEHIQGFTCNVCDIDLNNVAQQIHKTRDSCVSSPPLCGDKQYTELIRHTEQRQEKSYTTILQ